MVGENRPCLVFTVNVPTERPHDEPADKGTLPFIFAELFTQQSFAPIAFITQRRKVFENIVKENQHSSFPHYSLLERNKYQFFKRNYFVISKKAFEFGRVFRQRVINPYTS